MENVIGGFERLEQAENAVRGLEAHDISIQDIVVADRRQRVWRKLKLADQLTTDGRPINFIVIMRGPAYGSERARALLSERRS